MNIKIEDIEIKIAEDPGIWIKIREYMGSFTYRQPPGRNMKFFINQNDWLLGILELSSPVINLKARDKFLELGGKNKGKRLRNIANMTTCMATQPFGYFFNGGKLIALLGSTVEKEYKEKYGDTLEWVTTMGRNKRPTQYERAMKFLGYTLGKTYSHISDVDYARMMNWMKNNGHQIPSSKFGAGANARMRRIQAYIKASGDNTIKMEEMQRPVYILKTNGDRKEVIDCWYETFAFKRYMKILGRNK